MDNNSQKPPVNMATRELYFKKRHFQILAHSHLKLGKLMFVRQALTRLEAAVRFGEKEAGRAITSNFGTRGKPPANQLCNL